MRASKTAIADIYLSLIRDTLEAPVVIVVDKVISTFNRVYFGSH